MGMPLPNANDRIRALSPKGEQQARDRRLALGSPTFDFVGASPLTRTMQTAGLICGNADEVNPIDEFFYNEGDEFGGIDDMFKKLLYSPLSAYYAEPTGSLVRKHGRRSWSAALCRMREAGAQDALLVGHAVLSPALGHAAVGNDDSDMAKKLIEANLNECGGYKMYLLDDGFNPAVVERVEHF